MSKSEAIRGVCGCPIDIDYDYVNQVDIKPIYEKLGVTPQELHFRQTGKCWLQVVYDREGNNVTVGDIYCTDGKDFGPARGLLNPTAECVKCFYNFIVKQANEKMSNELKLNGFLLSILDALSIANQAYYTASHMPHSYSDPEIFFSMSRKTCNMLEEFIEATTMSNELTKPLRMTKNGDLLFFGVVVKIDNEVPIRKIILFPAQREMELPKNVI